MGFYIHCRKCKEDWRPASDRGDFYCPHCGSDDIFTDFDKEAETLV